MSFCQNPLIANECNIRKVHDRYTLNSFRYGTFLTVQEETYFLDSVQFRICCVMRYVTRNEVDRKKKLFRNQMYSICKIHFLSPLSSCLLILPVLKNAGCNLQYFTFICLQEYKQNNMHSFLCFSLNSFGIHVFYGGFCVGFLYSMC